MEIEHKITDNKVAVILTAKENGKVITRRTYFLGWGWSEEDIEKCKEDFKGWLIREGYVGSNNTTKRGD